MRKKTPSFIAEFPLSTTPADERELSIRLDAARQIYNASLGESLRRLDLMRESKAWQAAQFRTPAGDSPATPLPDTILGVPMQDVILDPTLLLTAALSGQTIESMVIINIATLASVQQLQPQPPPPAPPKTITFKGGGGGVENIPFLQANADAATLFATFWIEKIKGPTPDANFMQLQYVQTVFLNFLQRRSRAPADPGESVGKDPEQSAIAQAGVRGRVDRVQKLLNLAADKRRRFAFGP
jgi:hypothetical protein